MTNIFGRTGKFKIVLDQDKPKLAKLALDQIGIDDNTAEMILTPLGTPPEKVQPSTIGSSFGQIEALAKAGLKRFGCCSVTSSEPNLDGDLDGAVAMMLAEQIITSEDGEVATKRPIGIRLFFDGTRIKKIALTDNWIEEARQSYKKTGKQCSI